MKKCNLRKITKEDYSQIVRLWSLHFDSDEVEKRKICFQWIIKENPLSKNKDGYYVMVYGNDIIAYDGIMPYQFFLNSTEVNGYIYHDTMVNPKYRGQGIGTKLIDHMVKINTDFSIAVWMNKPNARVFEKCGWKTVNDVPSYVKVYNVDSVIKSKWKIQNQIITLGINTVLKLINSMVKLAYTKNSGKYRVENIEMFNKSIDELYNNIKYSFYCISKRTEDVLNWKFSRATNPRYTKKVCLENGKIIGYVVYRTRINQSGRRTTTIFDFLCAPDQQKPFRYLLAETIKEIEKEKTDIIEVLCTNKKIIRTFKRFGFIKSANNEFSLKFINSKNSEMSDNLKDGKSWFFTYGDGDKLFWEL